MKLREDTVLDLRRLPRAIRRHCGTWAGTSPFWWDSVAPGQLSPSKAQRWVHVTWDPAGGVFFGAWFHGCRLFAQVRRSYRPRLGLIGDACSFILSRYKDWINRFT